jgi:hypothetical protein
MKEAKPIKPSSKALLICDHVIEDKNNGKKSVIGIFTHITSAGFPCIQHQLSVYFCISNADGPYIFTLDLVYMNDGKTYGQGVLSEVRINDPLQTVDFAMEISPVFFPAAGTYEFRLYANGEFLESKDFFLKLVPQGS